MTENTEKNNSRTKKTQLKYLTIHIKYILSIAKPEQKTMHQAPDMIKGQAILGTPPSNAL